MAAHDLTVLSFPLQFSRRVGAYALSESPTRQFVRVTPVAKPIQRRSVSTDPARAYRVRGKVFMDPDLPVARMVYLYSEDDFMLLAQMLSDPVTGAFEFSGLLGQFTYMVVVKDRTGEFRAEAHDGLLPEPMA